MKSGSPASGRAAKNPGQPLRKENPWRTIAVCALLAAAVCAVFGQTGSFQFVNFDDDVYVYANPAVERGLTPQGILQAFTQSHASNWHPLTWISHMLDCQVYGLNPAGHHWTNVMLHAANAILLFLLIKQLTGRPWPSAFVAAIFAVHPLRVESVAWISERKDVLSGLFFMLTLLFYARYARQRQSKAEKQSKGEGRESRTALTPPLSRPTGEGARRAGEGSAALDSRRLGAAKRSENGSTLDYCLALMFFACGLMSKPMLVTVPFVLLLLDYWPLGRMRSSQGDAMLAHWRLVLEKIPFFLLASAVCAVTLVVQNGAVQMPGTGSFARQLENSVVSGSIYLLQFFWPARLAAFYPFPREPLPFWEMACSAALLFSITGVAFLFRRKYPWVFVGWFWNLGMLVPVIGLVQAGLQSHADRYTYLPQIGLALLLTWSVVELGSTWRPGTRVLAPCAIAVLAALLVAARAQALFWRDSESLWTHALKSTADNPVAEVNLATALSHNGRVEAAIAHSRRALEIQPDYAPARDRLGCVLLQIGQIDEAIVQFREGLRERPAWPGLESNLGIALVRAGKVDEGIAQFQNALRAEPDLAETHNDLAAALLKKGQVRDAILHYERALALKPDFAQACNNLAWVLATWPSSSIRNGARAIELARRANELSAGPSLPLLHTLAASYAEAGRFPEAIEIIRQARKLALDQNSAAVAEALQREINQYQAGIPLREPAQAP